MGSGWGSCHVSVPDRRRVQGTRTSFEEYLRLIPNTGAKRLDPQTVPYYCTRPSIAYPSKNHNPRRLWSYDTFGRCTIDPFAFFRATVDLIPRDLCSGPGIPNSSDTRVDQRGERAGSSHLGYWETVVVPSTVTTESGLETSDLPTRQRPRRA